MKIERSTTIGQITRRVKLSISWMDILKLKVLEMFARGQKISIEEQMYAKGIWKRPS